MKKKIWIDTDLAIGKERIGREGYSDVDDGYAILQLMKSEKVEIKGISAVFGNTSIENSFELCKFMSQEFAPYRIPVFKGAGEKMNLGKVETNAAVEGLAERLQEQKLTIMAIGPATNIGLLLLKYPELSAQIEEVVLVAGRRKATDYFSIGNKGRRAPDLNFDLCNDSFRLMFQHELSVTLCPFEISSKVWLKDQDLDALAKGDKGCQWLAEKSRDWIAQWKENGANGFNPFDVLASHYLIKPGDIIAENLNAHLEIHPDDTVSEDQTETFKQYLLCDQSPGWPVKYCYDVAGDYHQNLMDSLMKSERIKHEQ
jgi:pyrimidine-specific ribonucleoside hydrolase